MIKCTDCNKFLACNKASEDVIECLDFKKQKYDLEIENYSKSERIDINAE